MTTRRNRKDTQAEPHNKDYALFGLRMVYVIVLAAVLYGLGTQITGVPTLQAILTAVTASFIANLVFLLFILIPPVHPHVHWTVMLGDWVTIGAFVPLVYENELLTVALLTTLMAASVPRLGAAFGSTNAVISMAVLGGLLSYQFGMTQIQVQPMLVGTPLLAGGLLCVGLCTMMYFHEIDFRERHRDLTATAEERHQLVQDIQERTSAITEMAQMLSSSLNYQRVLDAALNVGQLALRNQNSTAGFVSLVLLYRSIDRSLYTVTGLGISRQDDGRTMRGRSGLVGEALTLCEPVFSGTVRRDPELGDFVTLRSVRSIVVVPLRAGFDNYGVMVFASRKPNAFNEDYRSFLEAIGTQTTIALQNAALYQDLLEEKERIVEVEKEARKRLARDLHDGPTQTISAIAMRMSIIRMMLDRTPEDVPAELKKIEELALQTTSEIRLMLYTLRPLALEGDGGLLSAVEQLADKYEAVYDQRVEVMVSERAERVMTEAQGETIFSIIQETVNNARKHARAKVINVRVTTYEEMLVVEVLDNGVGFDVEARQREARGRNSLGMQNLQDMANLLDATLTIDSAPGQGTSITVLVPIDPAGTRTRRSKPKKPRRKEKFKLAAIRL